MKTAWIFGAVLVALVGTSGCKRSEGTVLPVMDDPSTGEPGVDTVRASPPSPVTSEYRKLPPLGNLVPETGQQPKLFDGEEPSAPEHDAHARTAATE